MNQHIEAIRRQLSKCCITCPHRGGCDPKADTKSLCATREALRRLWLIEVGL